MNISVRTQGFERTAAIDAFVRNQLGLAMDRFADSILSIDAFMKDINGPKGGVDKQVVLRMHMRNGQQIAINTVKDDLYAAVCVAAKRAKRLARRNIRKAHRIERRGLRKYLAAVPAEG